MDLEKIGKGIMTSIEISELTCKLHKNVIADIRNEIQKLENAGIFTGLIFQPSEYEDSTGRTLPQIEKYGFEENQDFVTITRNLVNGGIETDCILNEKRGIHALEDLQN